jgi:hypothetical protein
VHSCDGMDTVMVFITMNGNKERIDNFCGTEIPAQLMSNGPHMRVEFKTLGLPEGQHQPPLHHHQSPPQFNMIYGSGTSTTPHRPRGFKAIYRFVTSESL